MSTAYLDELRAIAARAPSSIPLSSAPTSPPPGYAPVSSSSGVPSVAPFTPPAMAPSRMPDPARQGMAASLPFPVRNDAPNSQVIDNPLAGWGSVTDWENDWQARYNATPQYVTQTQTTGSGGEWRNATTDPSLLAGATQDRFQWQRTGVNDAMGNPISDPWVFVPGDPVQTITTQAANPAYANLQNERQFFEPLFENQTRVQQAYDTMAGVNAPNAMLPANYTQAGFGQVSGQAAPFAAEMGASRAAVQGADDAISNDFLSGIYDPQTMQATGMYRPPGSLGGLGGMGGPF